MSRPPRHAVVLSSGRSGSTLLSNMLREHPEVLSLSECFTVLGGPRALSPETMSGPRFSALLDACDPDLATLYRTGEVREFLRPPDADASRAPSPLLLVPLPHLTAEPERLLDELRAQASDFPSAPRTRQLGGLFAWLCGRLGRRVWVERSGGSIEYAEAIAEAFPSAGWIHLLRDGPDCALSMSKHPFFRVRLARVLAKDPALDVARCLEQTLPLDRFGAYWSALMARSGRVVAASPDPPLILSYEALVREPTRELERLAAFLGVACNPEWVARAAQRVRPKPSSLGELPRAQRERLELACRPGRRVLARLAPPRRELRLG